MGKTFLKGYRDSQVYGSVVTESLKPVITLLIIVFIWRRYNDITDWLNGLFKTRTNFYTGTVKDLPNDKSYYIEFVNNIVESVNGIGILNTFLYSILKLEDNELKYVNDIYHNPEYTTNTLVQDIKGDTIDNVILRGLLSAKFSSAGIPF